MMTMTTDKLLFLSPFFHPEPISTGRYNSCLAGGLREAGFEVTAISSHPLYPDWKPTRSADVIEGIAVVRGGAWMRYPRWQVLRRVALELWYLCFVAWEMPRHRSTTRVIVAVCPPLMFLPLARILMGKRIPVVGIVHDLQSVFIEKRSVPGGRVLAAAVRLLEGVALRACDHVIFLSHSMATLAVSRCQLDGRRCSVHYPFVSVPPPPRNADKLLGVSFAPGKRHVVYSGALGKKQNPTGLLESLACLTGMDCDVECHVFSRGPVFDELRQKYANTRGIHFHDLVKEEELPVLMAQSDVQLIPQVLGTSDAALPSKLPNLIAEGVPVLAVCDEASEISGLIERSGAGVAVHTWNPREVAGAAHRLLEMTRDDVRVRRQRDVAPFVERNFSLSRLVRQISGLKSGDAVSPPPESQ